MSWEGEDEEDEEDKEGLSGNAVDKGNASSVSLWGQPVWVVVCGEVDVGDDAVTTKDTDDTMTWQRPETLLHWELENTYTH